MGGGQPLQLDCVILLSDSLRNRLLSVGQLTREGYEVMFAGDQCMVIKDGSIVTTVTRTSNNLYPLRAFNLPNANVAANLRGERANLLTDENGKISVDSFLWPFPGDKGEKIGTIMTDRRRLIPITTRTRDETPSRIIVKLKQMNKTAMRPKQFMWRMKSSRCVSTKTP